MNLCFNKDCNLLVDRAFVNQTVNFYSSDGEDKYNFHKKRMPADWQYHTETIEYKFNSLGYRTKEISDLKHNFLLTFGCSFTEGVGLNEKDTWASLLANNLKLDLYNCAKQSTSHTLITTLQTSHVEGLVLMKTLVFIILFGPVTHTWWIRWGFGRSMLILYFGQFYWDLFL